jgi:phosphoribosylanthranilate isomerase
LRGGTGETFDWKLLSDRRSKTPLILSGGLSPQNVTEAIQRVRPYAVDTASGTESAPGRKDPAKLREFFAAVEHTAFAPSTELVSQVEPVPSAEEAPSVSSATAEGAQPSLESPA